MRAIKLTALGLFLLPIAEIVAFVLVTHAIGFVAALLLLILLSLSGISCAAAGRQRCRE